QRKTCNTQSDGVVLAKLRRAPRQPFRLADLALLHPAAGLALHPAPCRHAIGRGKAWVELDRAAEEVQRLLVARPRPWVNGGVRPQITIVGVEAVGRLAADALDLRLLELRRDGADHALGSLIHAAAV